MKITGSNPTDVSATPLSARFSLTANYDLARVTAPRC
jgi:hypothetical protein